MGVRGAVGTALVMVGVAGCGADEAPPVPLPGEEIFVSAQMEGALPLEFVMEHFPDGGITPSEAVVESAIIHGYMADSYLIDGTTIDIVWLHEPAIGYPESGDLRTQVTPVVFRSKLLDGWGWEHLDLRAAEWSIVDRSQRAAPPADTGSPADGADGEGTDIQSSDTQASAAGIDSSEEDAEGSESFSF
jgi:hypothetical protein